MELGCLLPYKGGWDFILASLSEATIVCYMVQFMLIIILPPGSYIHNMEIVEDGKMALLAGVGPMGLAAINYVLHREDRKPSLLVVTDIDQTRLDRAALLYTVDFAASRGIDLRYVNTGEMADPVAGLKEISGGRWV